MRSACTGGRCVLTLRFVALAGSRPGGRGGAPPAGHGLSVQDGDLLPRHAPAEGAGGGAGEEVPRRRHLGRRRRGQRRQHDQE